MDGWTCSLILEVSDVLDIFFEYSLKIPQICSNTVVRGQDRQIINSKNKNKILGKNFF
jgi:hypothetical protein